MMNANSILNNFLSHLLSDSYFADILLTRAYPDAVKPTLLKKPAVAVGIQSMELADNSVGENSKAGTFSVFADIFIPFDYDNQVPESIVFRICRDVADFNITAVSISEITANSILQCYVMRAVFTFNNVLCFGGTDDE